MNNTKQLLILFTIAIIASGCTNTTTGDTSTTSTSPIEINSFEGIPNPVPSGQQVTINLEAENTGDETADPAAARIFGPSFLNTQSAEERTKRFSGGLPAPTDERPSIPKRVSWTLTPPSIDENREVDYTIYSQIFYDYQTRATTDFRLVSNNRFRDQGYTQSDATIENTDGPIQIDIRGTTPKIFYEDNQDGDNTGRIESDVCVVLTNEGSGTAFRGGETDNSRVYNTEDDDYGYEEDMVRLNLEEPTNIEFDASGEEKSGNTVDVELVNGNEGYQCFTMRAEDLTNSETNVNTRITADYNYMEETSTTITSEGRRGAGPSNPDPEETSGDYEWADESEVSEEYSSLLSSVNDQDPNEECPELDQEPREELCIET